jgi:hypothetical protein
VLDLDRRVLAVRRGPRDGQTVVALHNVSAESVPLDMAAIAPEVGATAITDLLGGSGVSAGAPFVLPPYGVAWLAATRES